MYRSENGKRFSMFRLHIGFALLVCVFSYRVVAVDGIAVNAHWEGGNDNMYGGFGEIWRYDIEDDEVVRRQKLSSGPGRTPVISPNGKKVAYLTEDDKVVLMNADGSDKQTFADALGKGCIQFPMNEWVYYDFPRYNEDGSVDYWREDNARIYRKNIETGEEELVIDLDNGYWRWGVAADGKSMMVRHGEPGRFYHYDLVAGSNRKVGSGCGVGYSPSGTYWFHHKTHDALLVMETEDNDTMIDIEIISILDEQWPPDAEPVEYRVGANRNNYSRNSDEWVCFQQGKGSRGKNLTNQVLYNWKKKKMIVVPPEIEKNVHNDCGDFWIGTPGPAPDSPVLSVEPDSVFFSMVKGKNGPEAQKITVSNVGKDILEAVAATVSYSDGDGWLEVQSEGSGNDQEVSIRVSKALDVGEYAAVVTLTVSNSEPEARTISVAAKVTPDEVLSRLVLDPQNAVLEPNGTQSFSATALNEAGDSHSESPSVSWRVEGDGEIDQSGIYQAPLTEGGPYRIIAEATLGNVTVADTASVSVMTATNPLTLLSPTGGESYTVGDTLKVQWTTDVTRVTVVSISITVDNGITFHLLHPDQGIEINTEQWENFAFVIPSTLPDGPDDVSLVSSSCRIEVQSYGEEYSVVSPAVFEISELTSVANTRQSAAVRKKIRIQQGRLFAGDRQSGPVRVIMYALDGRMFFDRVGEFSENGILLPEGATSVCALVKIVFADKSSKQLRLMLPDRTGSCPAP